jgi:hypothetical protein
MNGVLDIYCLDCHGFVEWRKVALHRQDGYSDWRIEVFCGCGSMADERIAARARAAYDERLGVELETQHQNYFNSVLGLSGNLYFETLAASSPAVPPSAGDGAFPASL